MRFVALVYLLLAPSAGAFPFSACGTFELRGAVHCEKGAACTLLVAKGMTSETIFYLDSSPVNFALLGEHEVWLKVPVRDPQSLHLFVPDQTPRIAMPDPTASSLHLLEKAKCDSSAR